jgi:type I restriction enzyme S subunit
MQNGLFFKPSLKGIGVRLINVGDLFAHVPIDPSSLERFAASDKEQGNFKVVFGDLLFTRSSIVPAGIAHCNVYLSCDDESVVFDSHVIRVRPDQKQVLASFLFRFCVASLARRYLVANAKTGTMTTIDQSVLGKCPVLVPPLAEQEAVAEALSDVDALIESLEQLLAKKRHLKQGAMQELLTGKRRLPGFSGEWAVKRLGEVAAFHKGKGLPKSALDSSGSEPCIHYGELFTQYPETIRRVVSRTNASDQAFRSFANDVLMPTSDVTPNGLAKASCVGTSDVILGGDILVIRANPERLYGSFLSYAIRESEQQVLQLVTGSTVFHLYASDMRKFNFSMPDVTEQHAIVSVLDDMTVELVALASKLTKARQIKQGMMQELLTGKTRLL